MALSWCKVASNLDSHPKIRKAGRCGREVFLFALRRNAEPGNPTPGRIHADELEDWYVADQLQMPVTDAVTGVTAAVTAGLLVKDEHSYVIVGWKEGWGKGGGSGADRTAKWRENKRLQKSVTNGDGRDVTGDTSDGCDTEEKRRDKTRSKSRAPRADKTAIPEGWSPNESHLVKSRDKSLDLEIQAEEFRTGAIANGRVYADWNAAFHTWLNNAAKWRDERAARGGGQGSFAIGGGIRKVPDL